MDTPFAQSLSFVYPNQFTNDLRAHCWAISELRVTPSRALKVQLLVETSQGEGRLNTCMYNCIILASFLSQGHLPLPESAARRRNPALKWRLFDKHV